MTHGRWPIGVRSDDRQRVTYWCVCERPHPETMTLFGVALGGYKGCRVCHRPIIPSLSPGRKTRKRKRVTS